MTRSWVYGLVATASLTLGAVACDVDDPTEGGTDDPTAEAIDAPGSEPQLNCVAQCVQQWRACRAAGDPPESCNAEREACKEECYANTCEPGDPGCCQGQPTCW